MKKEVFIDRNQMRVLQTAMVKALTENIISIFNTIFIFAVSAAAWF
jgi:hypothetical protein